MKHSNRALLGGTSQAVLKQTCSYVATSSHKAATRALH
jgi:hypothetical protein